jgi:hypothetical protein
MPQGFPHRSLTLLTPVLAVIVSKNGLMGGYSSGTVEGICVVSLCNFVTYGELFK